MGGHILEIPGIFAHEYAHMVHFILMDRMGSANFWREWNALGIPTGPLGRVEDVALAMDPFFFGFVRANDEAHHTASIIRQRDLMDRLVRQNLTSQLYSRKSPCKPRAHGLWMPSTETLLVQIMDFINSL